MDDEYAPSRQVREGEKGPIAEGVLGERHGISITDAVILLAAITTARDTTATTLASQTPWRSDGGGHPDWWPEWMMFSPGLRVPTREDRHQQERRGSRTLGPEPGDRYSAGR